MGLKCQEASHRCLTGVLMNGGVWSWGLLVGKLSSLVHSYVNNPQLITMLNFHKYGLKPTIMLSDKPTQVHCVNLSISSSNWCSATRQAELLWVPSIHTTSQHVSDVGIVPLESMEVMPVYTSYRSGSSFFTCREKKDLVNQSEKSILPASRGFKSSFVSCLGPSLHEQSIKGGF